jgi:ferric-dicitrate binding protein FerR (iron transport regulator)
MKDQADIQERDSAELKAWRLLNANISESERCKILVYFTDDTQHAELKKDVMEKVFRHLLHTGRQEGRGRKAGHADEMWLPLARTLGIDPAVYRQAQTVVRRPLLRTWGGRVAAVLLPVAVALGGFFAWDSWRSEDGAGTGGNMAAATFVGTETIPAQADSIRHVTLPDGTEVTLNRNAMFAYNDHREAELSGEAYFKVAENPGQPFTIYSDRLKVTITGTEFNLNTRAEEGVSRLSLYEGSVRLDYAMETLVMDTPGNEFTLDHKTAETSVRKLDVEQRPQWLPSPAGEILSGIMSLETILDSIEMKYGVTIAGRDAVDMNRRFKFVIDSRLSLDSLMSSLEYLNGEFAYTINESTVTLAKK